ncbi:DUF4998 domain-containing protein [Flavobacterium cellulosilyticum]|uniref:DUF5013 domain-containing protein n=1 Tax=Flavobacterium cellulosilyticum TaxID=2541731 RepID=A0A4R5C7X8_9FLAO|nr:DUF4998 domain-containing protein [Flavobacterium cellulosilyticum]TDD95921.1 DUF5013 domain-containing protein [Flavobacterium cellulosilyticum]
MKFKQNYVTKLIFLSLFFIALSCSRDSLYEPTNNETLALGEVKSLVIKPGINSAKIEGVIDDPNVTEVKIFWDNKSKSIMVPVSNNGDASTFTTQIDNLQEKLYIFKFQTLDNQGESSRITSGGAKVYGSNYLAKTVNRNIVSSQLKDSDLNFVFNSLMLNTGILGTEIIYINAEGKEIEVFSSNNKTKINIADFKSGSTLRYRSLYKFSPLALDTIYTEYNNHKPFVLAELQNASGPFSKAEYDGKRWGNLAAPWITNDAAKNHNGYGGFNGKNKLFNMESGWGAPAITNGKIYQTIELDPATYQLKVTISATNLKDSDDGGGYIVIANGNGLPDVENITTATEVLGSERIIGTKVYYVEFTVTQTTEVSLGEVSTQSASGRYCNINSWELLHVQ